ncbi:MAG: NUDIX domain-containing protein, partial [Oceanobacter sp.]
AIDLGESISEAARRELQEEIGYNARELIYLKRLTLSPGYMSAGIHLVLARGLFPSQLEGDEPEPLETEIWSLSQWSELVTREDFSEGRAVAALSLVRAYLAGEFQGQTLA